jgi:hypothetical protein
VAVDDLVEQGASIVLEEQVVGGHNGRVLKDVKVWWSRTDWSHGYRFGIVLLLLHIGRGLEVGVL